MSALRALAVLAAIGIATPAGAAVYKCVGPDGKTSWSDKPCTTYPRASASEESADEAPVEVAPAPEAAAPPESPGASASGTPPEPAEPELSPEEQAQLDQEQMEQQIEAFEAEFMQRLERRAGLFWLSFGLMLVAWIMHIVVAAKMDKTLWAVCLFFLSPISNIPFTALNWQKARLGFFIYLGGLVLMTATTVSLYWGLTPPPEF